MGLDIDGPVCVIDIDICLINDYMDMINYPIEPGQFVAAQAWWKDGEGDYSLQGSFQKYYPKDCRYIYDKFVSDPEYWQEYYIKNGTTIGPVNGEQYFVEDSVRERLELKFLPQTWISRWDYQGFHDQDFQASANAHYPGEWLYLGGEFNPHVRLLHFQRSNTLPRAMLEARGL